MGTLHGFVYKVGIDTTIKFIIIEILWWHDKCFSYEEKPNVVHKEDYGIVDLQAQLKKLKSVNCGNSEISILTYMYHGSPNCVASMPGTSTQNI